MKTYIINLDRSVDRRVYMESVMRDYPWMDSEFVRAIDGTVAVSQGNESTGVFFDVKRSEKHYNTKITPGEVGCTLSHQLCYRKLLADESLPFVLILEDDIIIKEDFRHIIPKLTEYMSIDKPRIVLLSGMYWRLPFMAQKVDENHSIVKTVDALLTSSYLINRCAAKKMLKENLYIKADDWMYFKTKGISVEAIYPHLIDQDWSGRFVTNIYEKRYFISRNPLILAKIHLHGGLRRAFKLVGLYEDA